MDQLLTQTAEIKRLRCENQCAASYEINVNSAEYFNSTGLGAKRP